MNYKDVNNWRIMPRILVMGYALMVWQVAEWFMSLSSPSSAQSAFVSASFLAGAGVFKFYSETGNNDKK